MPFSFSIPRGSEPSLELTIQDGEVLFVLGANGTGKSGLMLNFYRSNQAKSRRISAQRQTWFQSNALSMSAMERKNTETNIKSYDNQTDSRWMEHGSPQRSNMALFDLIDFENVRARKITKAVDDNRTQLSGIVRDREASTSILKDLLNLSKDEPPIDAINELFALSNIPIRITVQESQEIFASKDGGPQFSIAQLSDGERNALLIAANVLTVKAGTLILIDEPERHLHRSIISPLLTLLFRKRPNCSFVISTHDVMLPLDNSESRTLLVRGCTFAGNENISAWDIDLVPSESEIDENLKRDILGARRKLLFVEGTEKSLDKPLYSLIFKNVSVIAKESCHDVVKSVRGIRDADNLHWIHAFGIIDNDGREAGDIMQLASVGVHAIPAHSIESIYYHPDIQRRIAELQSAVTGEAASALLGRAKTGALAAIRPHIRRLSLRAVERLIREKFQVQLPGRSEIEAATGAVIVSVDVPTIVTAEQTRLQGLFDNEDLGGIIERYPVRETSALSKITTGLGFPKRSVYESAVRKLLMDNPEALDFVRNLFGTLPADIDAT
jgi:ABC-type lipoprotein export system ATPase subunit